MKTQTKYIISSIVLVLFLAMLFYPTIKADDTSGTFTKIQIGKIKITTENEQNCDNPIIEVIAYDYSNLNICQSYLLYVDYYICCPGVDDHAWIEIELEDGTFANFDYGDGPPAVEGQIEIPFRIDPSPTASIQTFKVRISALYKDWIDYPWSVVLGQDTKYSTLKSITPKPMLAITDADRNEINTLTVSGTRGNTGSCYYHVANVGDANTDLTWHITSTNLIDHIGLKPITLTVSPREGNIDGVTYTSCEIHCSEFPNEAQTVNAGTITFYATGSNGYTRTVTVDVSLNIKEKRVKEKCIIQEWIKMLFRTFDRLFEWLRTIIPINYPNLE